MCRAFFFFFFTGKRFLLRVALSEAYGILGDLTP